MPNETQQNGWFVLETDAGKTPAIESGTMQTVKLDMVIADMKSTGYCGPDAKVGWIAARNKQGKFYMTAGKAAEWIVFTNNDESDIYRIVK